MSAVSLVALSSFSLLHQTPHHPLYQMLFRKQIWTKAQNILIGSGLKSDSFEDIREQDMFSITALQMVHLYRFTGKLHFEVVDNLI